MLDEFKQISALCGEIAKQVTADTDGEIRLKLGMINWETQEAIQILEKREKSRGSNSPVDGRKE